MISDLDANCAWCALHACHVVWPALPRLWGLFLRLTCLSVRLLAGKLRLLVSAGLLVSQTACRAPPRPTPQGAWAGAWDGCGRLGCLKHSAGSAEAQGLLPVTQV